MRELLLPGRIGPVKGFIVVIWSVWVLLSAGCSSGTDDLNLIPRPAELERRSGFFRPAVRNASVDTLAPGLLDTACLERLGPEGYELTVNRSSIRLVAATEAGLFYGRRTLEQLKCEEGYPCVRIVDRPRFAYRGVHMDVSRHFFPKDHVLKMLDEMARYKFNVFHFHLTDNGGWRLQIDKYPLLTARGAFRTQRDWYAWWDRNDRHYLPEGTPEAYGGYYSKSEIREIVAYAAARHITVIPEIEFPAHSDAVFIGYPELCCTGKPYTTGEFCVGNEQVYTFMEDVLNEVMELFPSKYIHIGGDEARKVAWATCPKCQALIRREHLGGIQDLQPYMISRIQDFLASKGRAMIGWDEILHNELRPETIVMSYRGQKGAIEAANRGNLAVMTPGEVLYFDWYQADPSTQPRAMYGYSPIKKMYSFEPVPTDRASAVRNEELIQGHCVSVDSVMTILPKRADRILGVQGCTWAEYIEDERQQEQMLFPRLLAVSELAWTPRERRDWLDFKRRMNAQIPELQRRGINTYTLSDEVEIAARPVDSERVEVTLDCEKYPVEIRYTLDGTLPTPESRLYEGPFEVADSVVIRAAVCRSGEMRDPVLTQRVTSDREIRNCYPFRMPELWREYFR